MLNFVDLLMEWARCWNQSSRLGPLAHAKLGDPDVDKRSGWLFLEGAGVAGQLTVWASGECELEAYRIVDGAVVLLEHRDMSTAEDLWSACKTLAAVCGGIGD